ncbi:MAG: metallophosphoesterase [Candidatus Peribacteraceae bacterium]|nr:metallophosphoesterase [Candidatus Peribacteraceae bacterium]
MSEAITFIADVHGDRRALRESLVQAKRAERRGSSLKILSPGMIMQTGDLLDRGNENLGTLETILEIMEQTKTILLAGNHDIVALDALNNFDDPEAWRMWMKNGGHTVLREVAKKYRLLLSKESTEFPVSLKNVDESRKPRIQNSWSDLVQKRRMGCYDFPTAAEKTRELFLDGQFAKIFDAMDLISEPREGVIAVHAGIDNIHAQQGSKHINKQFNDAKESGNFTKFGSHARDGKVVWMRKEEEPQGKPLTKDTAETLKENGRYVVIHGHNLLGNGKQELEMCHGIAVMNGDTGMSRGYKRVPNTWGYIHLDEYGNITANSQAGGDRDFGKVGKKSYRKPKQLK